MEDHARLDSRELSRAWHAVLGCLELELNPHNFATWLKGTRAVRCDDSGLLVEARSAMTCEWLNQRLRLVVERAAAQSFNRPVSVRFIPAGQVETESAANPKPDISASLKGSAIGTVNCKYTFDAYQTGQGNILAFRACQALVDKDELVVSPVVLYGSPGMGKTHLLHALACRAQALGQHVACLNAEEFANRFLRGLRDGQAEVFRDQIRSVDLLIIDDLQAIAGKKATIDDLVNAMEAVNNRGGHIAIASERHPFELGLPDRLESRLAAGILTRVDPFESGEQRQFIEAVARRHRISLPIWAIDRIARCPAPSVRVLLGLVNGAMVMHANGNLTLGTLDARLAGIVAIETAAESQQRDILSRIAGHFEVAVEDLCGRTRAARLNDARAVAAAALQSGGASLSQISGVLAKRDKSTIHGLCDRGRKLIEEKESLRSLLTG
jgi:chromosomal replication initiator protein